MIPKPLDEIEWADLETLKASGREESDTIEFKGSFSGGSDFLAFSSAQKDRAIKSIAKEAIAFLNGRGGDILIGAVEESSANPRIASYSLMPNISKVADQIAQTLAALIEPYQAVIGVRAIRTGKADEGVLIVRAPRSLRAPHRFTRDRECYVRRGREAVSMPMDEIQDMTLNRAMARSERNELLEAQFLDLAAVRCGMLKLDIDRVHLRVSYVPDSNGNVDLTQAILSAYLGDDPVVGNGSHSFKNDVAFRQLASNWQPELRGMNLIGFHNYNDELQYCKKSIKESMILNSEFAIKHKHEVNGKEQKMIYLNWIIGFFANTFASMRDVLALCPAFASGTLRIKCYASDGQNLVVGERVWARAYEFPSGTVPFPDFGVSGPDSFDRIFGQAQIDVCSMVGINAGKPYSFETP